MIDQLFIPDDEEFLTHEFSTVYETAKCERLEGMTKQQLIQEYLQLQTDYDQLLHQERTRTMSTTTAENRNSNWEEQVAALKEQIRKLNSHNNGTIKF